MAINIGKQITGIKIGGAIISGTTLDVNQLGQAIPVAEDGNVITSDYHNSLRDAILLLASQSGGPVSADAAYTYPPIFLPITDGGERAPEWVLALGIASRPLADNSARGWFPVQLPAGARIRTLTVTGNRSGKVLGCTVKLMQFTVADATTTPLITVPLKDVAGQFSQSRDFSAALASELQTVDNRLYQYLIVAELARADTDAVVDLYSIQIVCRAT
jgi:hypothetical protein